MSAEVIRVVVSQLNPARDAHDIQAVKKLLTDDVEYVPPASFGSEPIVGRVAVAERLASVESPYFKAGTMRRSIVRMTIGEDVAIVEQNMRCTSLRGRPYSNAYVWVYEFRGDKIRRLIEYADTLAAARQLGIVPV